MCLLLCVGMMGCVLNPSKLGVVYQDFTGSDGFVDYWGAYWVRTVRGSDLDE